MSRGDPTKSDLLLKLSRKNLIILKLSTANIDLRKEVKALKKRIQKLEKPSLLSRAISFIKKVIRL